MKSIPRLGPSLVYAPPCSVPTEPWGCGLFLCVCSHSSAAFFQSWVGWGVCAASLSIVCVASVSPWVSLEYMSVSGHVYMV